ncbi:MAG: ATP-binding protein [Thiotrichales bacterium]
MWRSWLSALPILGLFLLILASLYFMGFAAQQSTRFGDFYVWLLIFNVVLMIALLFTIVRRIYFALRDRVLGVQGSRLAFRLILMFVFAAVVPVFMVWAFSVRFLSSGLDRWFDVDIAQTLDNALELSQNSFDFEKGVRRDQAREIANAVANLPEGVVQLTLDRYRDQFNASELTLLGSERRIIATSAKGTEFTVPEFPSQQTMLQLLSDGSYVGLEPVGQSGMRIRAIVRVKPDQAASRTLIALFPISSRIGSLAESVEQAKAKYQQLEYLSRPLKQSFRITLSLVLLLATLFAIWAAFFMARKLLSPINELVTATKAVAEGDYRRQLPVLEHDELGFLVSSFNEMTARIHRAQESAEMSQHLVENQRSYLQAVLDHLSSGVITLDADYKVRTANEMANKILEMDKPLASFSGQHIAHVAQNRNVLQSFYDQLIPELLRRGSDWRREVRLFGRTGRKVLICRGVQLPDQKGRDGGYAIVIDDVTELITAQRDAAWGEVARRLAHEIKNPLTPIQLSAERLEHKLSPALPPDLNQILSRSTRTIVNQVEAMKEMVNTFRDYASPPPPQLELMDLNQLVSEVAELYSGNDEHVQIKLRLEHSLPKVVADVSRLRQVLHNLITNAIEAASQGEKNIVTLRTHYDESSQGRYIEVVVSDTGPGIAAEVIDELFEPYVSTKARGTGLGLAIVKKIADEHGGVVTAHNLPEGGAEIVLRLPFKWEANFVDGGNPDTDVIKGMLH